MFEYNYTREIQTEGDYVGEYNINNKNVVDGELNEILLCTEICESSIGVGCNIKCAGSSVVISFENELSGADQTTLDTVVSNYKANIQE